MKILQSTRVLTLFYTVENLLIHKMFGNFLYTEILKSLKTLSIVLYKETSRNIEFIFSTAEPGCVLDPKQCGIRSASNW